jgi:alkanesulfonate monooxygenase
LTLWRGHEAPKSETIIEVTLAWYCPSEGDGHLLGTRRPERTPTFGYLRQVVLAAEAAGAEEILIPTGVVNDSFAPDAPFMESWTTASALAAATTSIRLIVAVNPAAQELDLIVHQLQTLGAIAPGRIAVNLVAGGGPDTGYGAPRRDHDARYERLRRLVTKLEGTFDGPLFLGGASEAATALAAEVVDTYLMWGEPVDAIAQRVSQMTERVTRPLRFGLRIHLIARATREEARAAALHLISQASVRAERAGEYDTFDSVGQARMNALVTGPDHWLAPGLWAGIREVRGGAGTALVGSYAEVAAGLEQYRKVGIGVVIASGYPHLEEVDRVAEHVWPLIGAQAAA